MSSTNSDALIENLKAQGNAAFSSGDFQTAVHKFSDAIELDGNNHILYSNRSAAHCSAKNYTQALEDAEKALALNKTWAKGYGRKAAALVGLENYEEALQAYDQGLKLEPENAQLKKGRAECSASMSKGQDDPLGNFNPFAGPEAFERLRNNPNCREFMNQPDFLQKLERLRNNPKAISEESMKDPRLLQAMMVAMGLDIKNPSDFKNEARSKENTPPPSQSASNSTKGETFKKAPEKNPERTASDEEKDKGNKEYSLKNFEAALEHYEKSWELDPTNIVVLNNKAAVLFEQGNYEDCIASCEKAVELGREAHCDFQIIAKAFGRIGAAYLKLENYDQSLNYYKKSLAEHRTPETLKKIKEVERTKEEKIKKGNYDPVLSEKERTLGNEAFSKGEYPEAIKHYTEAIKRNEKEAKNYSNRAACYAKLKANYEALKDCETCIKLDPSFTKAYIRKAHLHFEKKEYFKVEETLEKASSTDVEGKNRTEINNLLWKCMEEKNKEKSGLNAEETLKRAQEDPEIRSILSDPVMQQILEQMQANPQAIMEHMKNPIIANKIGKLMTAGIIRTA